jgi:hypothetical protein
MISGIVSAGLQIIEKVIPDPEQRQKAKLELLKQQQEGKFKEMEIAMSAIIAEAKSQDVWTSRARPSFMYVMYALFLSAVPMGFLFAFNPEVAGAVTTGVQNWLNAIPDEMYWLFGSGYLGYSAARSYDKKTITKKSETTLI